MKITHRLFASIVISALTFISLLAVTDVVSNKQQNSQEIRTIISKLDKQFLHAQVDVRAHADNPQSIDQAFEQIELTREELLPLRASDRFGEVNKLNELLDLYKKQFTLYAASSAKVSAMEQIANKNMEQYAGLLQRKQASADKLENTEASISEVITRIDQRLEKYVVRKDLSLERIRWISIISMIVISLVLTNLLVGSFTRPFKRLVNHINLLAAGQLNIQTDITGRDELGQLGKLLNSMSRQLDRAFNELKNERDLLTSTIEELKKAQQDLHHSETRYNRLFETSADAILIIQGEKIMQCNRAALDLFRVESTDAFKRMQVSDLSPEKQENGEASFIAISQHIAAAYQQGEHEFSWLYKHQKGETFQTRVIFTVVDLGYTQLLQAAIRQCCVQDSADCK